MPEVALDDNPYFAAVAGGVTVGGDRVSHSERGVEVLHQREDLVERYAWAIPNEAAIQRLVEEAPLLEVGAGTGYWACLVDQVGGEIVATDADPSHRQYFPVQQMNAVEAVRHGRWFDADRTLFICWPPYDDPMAVAALDAYEGDRLVYVGEGRGGCTADARFHRTLHREWECVDTVAIPTYLGVRDRLEVWSR